MPHRDRFSVARFVVRRKVFTLLGAAFHIYDAESGGLLLYSRQKAFRLREDLRLYTGEDMAEEVLRIHARSILDFGTTYDIIDAATNDVIGALRRRGFKSMLRDEWTVLGPGDQERGRIQEDSAGLAMIRRVFDLTAMLIPQDYHLEVEGQTAGRYRRRRNPFVHRVEGDFSEDVQQRFDRRMAIAGAVLLCAIEQRQD